MTVVVFVGAVTAVLWIAFVGLPRLIDRTGDECHRPPVVPYTVRQAHMATQRLIDCDATTCAAKAAALQVLHEAGRATPATEGWRR